MRLNTSMEYFSGLPMLRVLDIVDEIHKATEELRRR